MSLPFNHLLLSSSSSLPSAITSSSKESNDQLKSLIVKQCTEELISPNLLANMHKKSEKTIRNWVKSSGAHLPLKYREKYQRKIAFTSNYGHHSLVTANNATQLLTKQLVLNLKSNWPSLSKNTIDSQPNSCNSKNFETDPLELDLEKRSKIGEKTFQCPKCSFTSSAKNSLDKHLNGHNDCQICGVVFIGSNGKRKLASHMKTHEVKPKKQQLCVFCNKEYKDRRILNRHLKICKKKPRDVQPII